MAKYILIAEDEFETRRNLVGILHLYAKFEIRETASAPAAIELLQQSIAEGKLFDAVLTDGVLRPGHGHDIIRAMRLQLPEYKETPIFAASKDATVWKSLIEFPPLAGNLYTYTKMGSEWPRKVPDDLTTLISAI